MKLIPYEKVLIAGGREIWITKHPVLNNDFGVRPSHEFRHIEGQYVCMGTPGTGYFAHDVESDQYIKMVSDDMSILKPSYWRYLTGKEFSYEKEFERIDKAMEQETDVQKHAILESYYNSLRVMVDVDRVLRVMDALKEKVKLSPRKDNISPLSHYKSRLHVLAHEMKSSRFDMNMLVNDEEQQNSYYRLVEAFKEISNSRRVWNMLRGEGKMRMERVYWDLGVFNFMVGTSGTPLMRDMSRQGYFIYPQHIVVARSSTDFDIYNLKDLHFIYRETTQESLVAGVINQEDLIGRPMGEVAIEELGVRWYFMHRSVAYRFVDAMNRYIAGKL